MITNRTDAARYLLTQLGASPDTPTSTGRTPLSLATTQQMTRLLNELRPDPDTPVSYVPRNTGKQYVDREQAGVRRQDTPALTYLADLLSRAIEDGRADAVHYLCRERGASPDALNSRGQTPLSLAREDTEMLRLLLRLGADPNTPSSDGSRPLHSAIAENDNEAVELLLRHKADPNLLSNGCSPLERALLSYGYDNMIRLLDHGANPNIEMRHGVTPLIDAINIGFFGVIDPLLDHGADVNGTAADRVTPLHFAVNANSVDAVLSLLRRGADLNARDSDGATPLHLTSDTAVAQLLLDHGADPYLRDNHGRTPFDGAVSYGEEKMIRLFLDNGYVPFGNQVSEKTSEPIKEMIQSRIRDVKQSYHRSKILSAVRKRDEKRQTPQQHQRRQWHDALTPQQTRTRQVVQGVRTRLADDVFRELVRYSTPSIPASQQEKQRFRQWCQRNGHPAPEDTPALERARRLDKMRRQQRR